MTTTGSGISPATDWAGQAGLARAWHRQDGASSNLVDEALNWPTRLAFPIMLPMTGSS
jgi:hypothetical protein